MSLISEPQTLESTQSVAQTMRKLESVATALAAEAAETEAQQKLTDRAIELLIEAGVTRVFLPKELGGMGLFPGEALPILDRVARIDGSIGWVNTIFAAGGHMIDYLEYEPAREIIDSGEPLFGAVSNGAATAVAVDGGWSLTGSYRYASGSKHARFIFTPAQKLVDGEPVQGPPAMFAVPTSEISYGEGWDTIGLRGTGSVDFTFTDVFVPAAHEAVVLGAPILGGDEALGGVGLLIPLMHLGFATGITRRILDDAAANANRPPSRPGAKRQADNDRFRIEYAQLEMKARAARALVTEVLADIDDTLREGCGLSREQTSMLMGANIHTHDIAREVAEWAYRRGGGTTLRAGDAQRAIRDALAGVQHFIVDDSHMSNVGWDLLGAPDNYIWMGPTFGPIPGTE
ncbi:acyl-CoA dehydrogenase family protein [Microbacterium thalassium]|uniref:Alkylation response protein AidB-like acyl-CoA dehydrogenase n=1 Tax=Microbacterium thalassium TaxID=362649 RepID=A0A7X0FME0_9MICO|nr:acyl-CoA dehydrogenase family protein [Microbacterium thalassium]MBB6390193.1 alkylation response protein AidB-like acyl-CoA dehydrogenase [Microbacterium thalassium]GLK25301.1 acyl-CoA dehydrogenase [Microbacterium thalassium]